MKERGMIFNADMVRAILDGRKTQTRRIIKLSHERGMVNPVVRGRNGEISSVNCRLAPTLCPHGDLGDRIWVRETFNGFWLDEDVIQEIKDGVSKASELCDYRADYPDSSRPTEGWTPSIHMPRWASRITLEITGIHVERLNNISEGGAQAEGASPATHMITPPEAAYRVGFRHLWESIYGEESWKGNPWVWVIEFRRVEA